MYCLWMRFSLSLVSILGLTSCMAESGAVRDTWKISEPWLHQNGQATQITQNIAVPVRANASIKFKDGAQGTSLTVMSECRRGQIVSHSELKTRNYQRVPIASLIPAEFLRSIEPEASAQELSCHFNFLVKNKVGSTHRFYLQAVAIRDLETIETIKLLPKAEPTASKSPSHGNTGVIETANLTTAVADAAFEIPAGAKLELHCENFQNWRLLSKPKILKDLFDDLVHGKIQDESGNEVSSPLPDSRSYDAVQNCRVIAHQNEKSSGIPLNAFSPIYEMRFKPLEPKMKSHSPLATAMTFSAGQPALFVTEIRNPTPFPLAFRFLRNPKGTITIREVISSGENQIAKRSRTAAYQLAVSGEIRAWTTGPYVIFEVKPGKVARLALESPKITNSLCHLSYYSNPTPFSKDRQIGFIYQFSHDLSLEQFFEWDVEKPKPLGPVTKITPFPAPVGAPGSLKNVGWIPRKEHQGQRFDLSSVQVQNNEDLRDGACPSL